MSEICLSRSYADSLLTCDWFVRRILIKCYISYIDFLSYVSSVSAQASGFSELVGPPPLAYKKWRFDGQKQITDIASCGEVIL